MSHSDVKAWIDGYVKAWRTHGTAKLADLFTTDVRYRVSPWRRPINGLKDLEIFWEKARQSPSETFELQSTVIAVDGPTAVARLEVTYSGASPARWRDIWVMTFDATGKCRSFEEWPFSPDQDDGQDM